MYRFDPIQSTFKRLTMKNFLVCLLLFSNYFCHVVGNEVDKPNVLLIVVDDQGCAEFSPFEKHDTTGE